MSDLTLSTIDLTTSLAVAPLNGPPSSADYNETQREILTDLSNLATFINNTVIPLFSSLVSTALTPTPGIGIEGSTVISDSTDTSEVFYDSVAGASLSIADSLRVLMELITALQLNFTDIDLQIGSLQSTLTNSNQGNLAATVSGLQASINNLIAIVSSQATEISSLTSLSGLFESNSVSTGSVPESGTIQVSVALLTPYADNNYTPLLSLEDPSGQLRIVSFTYQTGGVGVFVLVENHDATATHTGTIHILTKH